MELVQQTLRSIENFPKPGVIFKDITPVLANPFAYKEMIDGFERLVRESLDGGKIDKIVAIESRGFLIGAPLADRLGAGLVLARKPGKLPYKKISESFKLEYGEDTLEMHEDSINKNERVLIVDDVLATGGTMEAATKLVKKLDGDIQLILFFMEIPVLKGGEKLRHPYKTLI